MPGTVLGKALNELMPLMKYAVHVVNERHLS